jgi:HSP20 family molecular chaperone IbpA
VTQKIRTLRLRLIEGQIGEVAYQLTKVHFAQFQESGTEWRPQVNVFQCASCFRVCVELAGLDDDTVEVEVGPGKLRISGYREAPEPLLQHESTYPPTAKPVRVITMEIDHGRFQRDVDIPDGYDYRNVTTEWENGLLWILMPRLAHA